MNRKVEETADGSHTIYIEEIDEHYHSVNGAIQESIHVFINAGLNQIEKKKISVLEIGFGTGLNAYLTLLYSLKNNVPIQYTGVEIYPLDFDFIKEINYPDQLNEDISLFHKLHSIEWGKEENIVHGFDLRKLQCDFTRLDILKSDELFDVIYYDAFAPDKQSTMWTQEIFDYLFQHTQKGGVFVTYCAKGIVRRMLQQAGYTVERLPGPKGKREMLRAMKLE